MAAAKHPKRGPNRIGQDLREMIQQALHAVGGRRYLISVARRHPELFLQLVAKVIPKEIHGTFTARYEAMPVRVEARPSAPLAAPPAALAAPEPVDAEFTVKEAKVGDPAQPGNISST